MWVSGRTSIPGVSMSMISNEMPLCFGDVGIGADVAEALLGDRRVRRPHLLAVDDEVVVEDLGAGLQAGEVGARIGFAHADAPNRVAACGRGASARCSSLPNSSRLGVTIA